MRDAGRGQPADQIARDRARHPAVHASASGWSLTEAGRDFLAVVRDALDRIASGTDQVVKRQNSGILTISTSPDFAAKWLVNRLGRFAEKFPDIDLRISAS